MARLISKHLFEIAWILPPRPADLPSFVSRSSTEVGLRDERVRSPKRLIRATIVSLAFGPLRNPPGQVGDLPTPPVVVPQRMSDMSVCRGNFRAHQDVRGPESN